MNNKYIIGGILAFIVAVAAYFLFSKPSPKTKGPRGPDGQCLYGQDKSGNCLPMPETCGNKRKPPYNCPNNQPLICDNFIGDWRCKLDCESDNNPFPKDFSQCQYEKIKCDPTGKYYCDSDYCQNGGILYSNSNGICQCDPLKFKGEKCECNIDKCKGGDVDNVSNCKCISCCDKNNNEDAKGRCKHYGDDGNCSKECGDNQVYDPVEKKCVCKSGFIEDPQTKKCTAIDCGPNGTLDPKTGKCDCGNSGFEGDLCKIPKCENGKWNPSTQSCECDKDAVGPRCQYTRKNFCNNNGSPKMIANPQNPQELMPICQCDKGFDSSPHCACDLSKKPSSDSSDNCKGIEYKCKEKDDYTGQWSKSYLSCEDIYKKYNNSTINIIPDEWQKQCTNILFNGKYYPANKAKCSSYATPSPNGEINDFTVYQTCDGTPTQDMLDLCKKGIDINGNDIPPDTKVKGEGCYISWNDAYNDKLNTDPTIYRSYCSCKSVNGNASYVCSVTTSNDCGPKPPTGYCSNGGDPVCISYLDTNGENAIYACPGTRLPTSVAIHRANLQPHPINNNPNDLWWAFTQGTETDSVLPLFPTVNMDICDKNNNVTNLSDPTSDGQQQLQGFNPVSDSVSSKLGFVTGTNKSSTFYDYNNPNILKYNVTNAKLSDDKKTISFVV